VSQHSATHYLLEAFCDVGIEYLFCNLGTDHVPIIEELARWKQEGRRGPEVILCAHENLAMHMAMGYAMATGRGQAVLVHVDVGTANAAMGMHNLLRSRVPCLLFAGKAPFTGRGELPGSRDTFVNFLQEPFDQAGLVRPYAKWTYDLPSGMVAKSVVARAHIVMHSGAPGPVFLSAAREVLMAEQPESEVLAHAPPRQRALAPAGLDDASVSQLARMISAARAPVLITAYAGRNPEALDAIDALSRLAGMRVYESNAIHVNIPRDSPCFSGFVAGAELADADLVLMVDVDVPWVPKYAKLNPQARFALIDIDALKRDMPIWDFPVDVRLQADAASVLRRVAELLKKEADDGFRTAAATRLTALTRRRQMLREQTAALAKNRGVKGQLSPAFVAAELNKVMAPDDILVHETITNVIPVMQQIERTRPLTAFSNGGGGLGIGGVALGAKLAHPDRLVVHVSGDGSFVFSNPLAMMLAERRYGLPVFTVILDNGGWGAVKGATLRALPDGCARQMGDYHAVLGSGIHHEKLAETVGGYGECVEDPDDLAPAIQRCVHAVRSGSPAILVVRIERIDLV